MRLFAIFTMLLFGINANSNHLHLKISGESSRSAPSLVLTTTREQVTALIFMEYIKRVGIYKITSPSGSVYIGQSRDILLRLRKYKNVDGSVKGQLRVHRSFVKYGVENHKFEILFELSENVAQKVLNDYEIALWKKYKKLGYEMLNIREPGSNGTHSEATKKKISDSKRGQKYPPRTEEHKYKNKQAWVGRKHTEESKRRISESKKGQSHPQTEATRAKMRGNVGKWMLGRKLSPETLAKVIAKQQIPISQFSLTGEWIRDWDSATIAAKELNFNKCSIRMCCRGLIQTAHNFIWKNK